MLSGMWVEFNADKAAWRFDNEDGRDGKHCEEACRLHHTGLVRVQYVCQE